MSTLKEITEAIRKEQPNNTIVVVGQEIVAGEALNNTIISALSETGKEIALSKDVLISIQKELEKLTKVQSKVLDANELERGEEEREKTSVTNASGTTVSDKLLGDIKKELKKLNANAVSKGDKLEAEKEKTVATKTEDAKDEKLLKKYLDKAKDSGKKAIDSFGGASGMMDNAIDGILGAGMMGSLRMFMASVAPLFTGVLIPIMTGPLLPLLAGGAVVGGLVYWLKRMANKMPEEERAIALTETATNLSTNQAAIESGEAQKAIIEAMDSIRMSAISPDSSEAELMQDVLAKLDAAIAEIGEDRIDEAQLKQIYELRAKAERSIAASTPGSTTAETVKTKDVQRVREMNTERFREYLKSGMYDNLSESPIDDIVAQLRGSGLFTEGANYELSGGEFDKLLTRYAEIISGIASGRTSPQSMYNPTNTPLFTSPNEVVRDGVMPTPMSDETSRLPPETPYIGQEIPWQLLIRGNTGYTPGLAYETPSFISNENESQTGIIPAIKEDAPSKFETFISAIFGLSQRAVTRDALETDTGRRGSKGSQVLAPVTVNNVYGGGSSGGQNVTTSPTIDPIFGRLRD